MSLAWVLLNLAYVAYVASPMFKEMFALRIVLLVATAFFIAYGVADGIWSVIWWNIAFGAAHLWQLAGLIRERRAATLTDEEEAIRTLLFPALDRVDFVYFWEHGVEVAHSAAKADATLVRAGEPVNALMLLLDGEAEVTTPEGARILLRKLSLVGEMSLISGNLPTADVRCHGPARLRSWSTETLAAIDADRPQVSTALYATIGRDLSAKLRNPKS